jgi:hypothetical protein
LTGGSRCEHVRQGKRKDVGISLQNGKRLVRESANAIKRGGGGPK